MKGIHLLLTYQCTLECDHCFLYSSPRADGTMTLAQVRNILDEARRIGTVEWIYFEGGEPLLFSLSTIEGARLARSMGFEVGIVTNAYWAVSDEDAEVWLRPLAELGIGDLSVSDDSFHYGDDAGSPARRAVAAARRLGIPTSSICIEKPFVEAVPGQGQEKGRPVIGGGAMFKGRAVEKLTAGLPRRPWRELTTCPHEDLVSPSRVHIDPYGNVHLCQGVSMGNMWERPLSELVAEYEAQSHPVCGPLVEGGPALLAERYGVFHDDEYVDECHFCYVVRRALVDRFPECLAPRQVYALGLDPCTGVAGPVVIHEYDPEWPRRFAGIRDALTAALDGLAVAVEHVGSTAVVGLAAKPVIDVDVVVESSPQLAAVIDRLRGLGYERLGELGVPGREAFRAPAPEALEEQSPLRTVHHLYVVCSDSQELARHRAFRDALRAEPALAEEYAALKRRQARELEHDREAYTAAKTAFIEAVLGRTPPA